ncbi:hypothetical protein [Methanosphaera sp. WGK6]|uniref:amino acid kinase family protein n=1 Tax=Methanosphaera sp. WGK6 TaxID=1561964 RepID=UPI00084CD7A4|nr:hypothetical protein [Methanosphaera sp. WGK6]OED30450.1 hypothetical protein NL43_02155 [Methanosphaera sp. WGK6]
MTTVIKIGGSLFPKYIKDLCDTLKKSREKIVLVNGGGALANKLREFNQEYSFSNDTNHWTAIECMDILGKLIADKNEDILLIEKIEDISKAHKNNKIPLLLTYDLLKKEDPLEHSWNITSDSIACWIAHRINAKLLILTNVDGIYSGNIFSNNKKLIKKISANKLLLFEETSVDKCLPKLLIDYHLDCYIMNGKYPDRVLAHLNSDYTMNNIYTYIGGK